MLAQIAVSFVFPFIIINVLQFGQVTFLITKQRSSITLPMLMSSLKVLQNLEVEHFSTLFWCLVCAYFIAVNFHFELTWFFTSLACIDCWVANSPSPCQFLVTLYSHQLENVSICIM